MSPSTLAFVLIGFESDGMMETEPPPSPPSFKLVPIFKDRGFFIAKIDQTRCITWAEGRDCIVCEEMCPVPEKAIRLGGGGWGRGLGGGRHPRVIEDLCIGCGICEHQCPVAGESAIRIYPVVTTT